MWVPKRFLLLFKNRRKRKPSNVTSSANKPIQKSREQSARLSRSSHQPPVVEIVWNGISHLGFTLKRRRNGEVLVGRIKDASVPLSVGNVLTSIGGISVQRLSRKELKALMNHMSKPLLFVFLTNQGSERRERMSTVSRVHEEARANDSSYSDFMRESAWDDRFSQSYSSYYYAEAHEDQKRTSNLRRTWVHDGDSYGHPTIHQPIRKSALFVRGGIVV
uniref:AlNc14C189G8416 protein n=1 Tax=Albugo laibachii Nc14 TaxID=890382 RepID=F0WPS4_9STRA|nr:AlNc14C189G8416 [Albugo laibachii Nc14]CCA24339.1 AlNc14C235G9357 [Albugo laibachii Nc14]|eukprot:CCA24339.1 AlNc14C235G9357 [Albugo laibachii Nc14]